MPDTTASNPLTSQNGGMWGGWVKQNHRLIQNNADDVQCSLMTLLTEEYQDLLGSSDPA